MHVLCECFSQYCAMSRIVMDYHGLIMPFIFLSSVKITKHISGQDWWLPWFLQTMAGVHAWPGNTTPLGKISIRKTRNRTRWSHLTTSSFWINQIPVFCSSKFVWHGFLSLTVNFWGIFCICLVTNALYIYIYVCVYIYIYIYIYIY